MNETHLRNLPYFQAPNRIFSDSYALDLRGPALAVYLVLLYEAQKSAKLTDPVARVVLEGAELETKSGFSSRSLTEAVEELQSRTLVSRKIERLPNGMFRNFDLTLLNPGKPGQELLREPGRRHLFIAAGLPYFLIPSDIITRTGPLASLRNLSSSQLAVYIVALFQANYDRNRPTTEITASDWKKRTGIKDATTFAKAMDAVVEHGLLATHKNGRFTVIELCDPMTREPIGKRSMLTDIRTRVGDKIRRADFNDAVWAVTLDEILSVVPKGTQVQGTGDKVLINCPFHTDSTPSCRINLRTQFFDCFSTSCRATGTLNQLLQDLGGAPHASVQIDRGRARGIDIFDRDRDRGVEAVYEYRDRRGRNLIKRVRRKPGKNFDQYKLVKGERVWENVPKALYNLDLFDDADVICILEGEKDADTWTGLQITAAGGTMIPGSTTGGSGSWDDKFADEFAGRRVLICADNDKNGRLYAEAITVSLDARGIEHHTISLPDGVKDFSAFLASHGPAEVDALVPTEWHVRYALEIM